MVKRIKRLMKQREGLLNQIKKHEEKLNTEKGRKDTTHDYWKEEIKRFKERARQREEILNKLKKRSLKK